KGKSDGSFSITVDLPVNEKFQFRYLINGATWINDDQADEYTPSPFGNESNSVVRT
ncbi:MAG: glycoside hydrolase, partial [Halothiobacillus sp. 15-55-196]